MISCLNKKTPLDDEDDEKDLGVGTQIFLEVDDVGLGGTNVWDLGSIDRDTAWESRSPQQAVVVARKTQTSQKSPSPSLSLSLPLSLLSIGSCWPYITLRKELKRRTATNRECIVQHGLRYP